MLLSFFTRRPMTGAALALGTVLLAGCNTSGQGTTTSTTGVSSLPMAHHDSLPAENSSVTLTITPQGGVAVATPGTKSTPSQGTPIILAQGLPKAGPNFLSPVPEPSPTMFWGLGTLSLALLSLRAHRRRVSAPGPR